MISSPISGEILKKTFVDKHCFWPLLKKHIFHLVGLKLGCILKISFLVPWLNNLTGGWGDGPTNYSKLVLRLSWAETKMLVPNITVHLFGLDFKCKFLRSKYLLNWWKYFEFHPNILRKLTMISNHEFSQN